MFNEHTKNDKFSLLKNIEIQSTNTVDFPTKDKINFNLKALTMNQFN